MCAENDIVETRLGYQLTSKRNRASKCNDKTLMRDRQQFKELAATKDLRISLFYDRKQSSMVDENVLKVRIRKVRGDLNKRADCVMSLEMRKEKLDTGKNAHNFYAAL